MEFKVDDLAKNQEFSKLSFKPRLKSGIKYRWNQVILVCSEAESSMPSLDWESGMTIMAFTSPFKLNTKDV